MSAPDTNVEKQARRHRPALRGIAVSMLIAALLFAGYVIWLAAEGNAPGDPEARVDGRTGEVEAVD